MLARSVNSRTVHNRQDGSFLIIVMIGVAVTMIGLGVAAQSYSTALRRDKEEELIFRARQYVHAILAYRKEHGGQFPLTLEDLHKPGPRRLRYIRKLYPDPIARDGKWGLLYLMPGGQGVYDPVAAARQQEQGQGGWGSDTPIGAGAAGAPGVIPIGRAGGQTGATGPVVAGALPVGSLPTPPRLPPAGGAGDEERISEPPLGWPIVGVVSRAADDRGFAAGGAGKPGAAAGRTFKIYKGHDQVSQWQFHVFDLGVDLPQAPGQPGAPAPPAGLGPGIGGKGIFQGMGPVPGRGPMYPGMQQPGKWGLGGGPATSPVPGMTFPPGGGRSPKGGGQQPGGPDQGGQ
jgi:type II secretory pathway pseudopilin PulG